jgi:hypothetical protein
MSELRPMSRVWSPARSRRGTHRLRNVPRLWRPDAVTAVVLSACSMLARANAVIPVTASVWSPWSGILGSRNSTGRKSNREPRSVPVDAQASGPVL